jgi:hypothetical protein
LNGKKGKENNRDLSGGGQVMEEAKTKRVKSLEGKILRGMKPGKFYAPT